MPPRQGQKRLLVRAVVLLAIRAVQLLVTQLCCVTLEILRVHICAKGLYSPRIDFQGVQNLYGVTSQKRIW